MRKLRESFVDEIVRASVLEVNEWTAEARIPCAHIVRRVRSTIQMWSSLMYKVTSEEMNGLLSKNHPKTSGETPLASTTGIGPGSQRWCAHSPDRCVNERRTQPAFATRRYFEKRTYIGFGPPRKRPVASLLLPKPNRARDFSAGPSPWRVTGRLSRVEVPVALTG